MVVVGVTASPTPRRVLFFRRLFYLTCSTACFRVRCRASSLTPLSTHSSPNISLRHDGSFVAACARVTSARPSLYLSAEPKALRGCGK
jgi:hypothetical protein